MITTEEFKQWLNDPSTRFFKKWVEKNHDDLKKIADDISYNQFHLPENDRSKLQAKQIYGLCNGLKKVLDLFKEAEEQVKEENKNLQLEEKDKEGVHDFIKELIEYISGGSNDNN